MEIDMTGAGGKSLIDNEVLVVTEECPGYLRAVIDNPPMGLIDNAVFAGFRLLREHAEAHGAKVIVFESADPDFFVAHLDVRNVHEAPDIPGAQPIFDGWPEWSRWLSTGPVITIAKVRGIARGIGNEFICACDMRFASREHARFAQLEEGYGLVPGGGGLEWLPKLVGRGRAMEIVMGAEDFTAETAELYGWINRAVPDAELDQFVALLARRIASFDAHALQVGKRMINDRCEQVSEDELRESFDVIMQLTKREESKSRYALMGGKGDKTREGERIRTRLFF
jgi:enoyl-CoA hydratase/carnithine racemase